MRFIELIASGTILWFVLAVALALLALLIWKWPLVMWFILWPFRKFWAWFTTETRPGKYLVNTRWWLWIEKQNYDPPPKPLKWWLSRGALVLFFMAVISAAVFERGRVQGRNEAPAYGFASIAPDADPVILKKVARDYERQWRQCTAELEAARLPEIAPVKVFDIPLAPQAPAPPSVQATEPVKMFKAPVTKCAPEWLCKLDKSLGLTK